MAEEGETAVAESTADPGKSKALQIARQAGGIKSSKDFSNVMSNLMVDLLEGAVTPHVGNAVCNAGGKLLKMAELTLRYGRPHADKAEPAGEKVLLLASE